MKNSEKDLTEYMDDKLIKESLNIDKKIEVLTKNNKTKKIMVFIGSTLLFICIVFLLWFFKTDNQNSNGLISSDSGNDFGKMIFLLLGVDNDPKGDNYKRSDTMMLAFVNTYSKKVHLLSIPRDTKIFIENKGDRKINAAFRYGGVEMTRTAIEELLEIKIDHFINIDINGFVNIIDVLGGIDIEVEDDMHYIDRRGELYIDIKKGYQHLDGRKSMYYVRYRDKIYADIGRIKRQQKFLKVMFEKMKKIGIVWKLPSIIQEIYYNMDTDLGIKDIINIMKRFRDIDLGKVGVTTLPGEPKYIDKVSYYVHDHGETSHLIESIMEYKGESIKNEKHEISDTQEINQN
ncbi:MAG: LCP family protein [Candidatus Muirbacterium halophilum]|nr:LCP family protein [Candidatus Muirbacterium halophilum]